MAVLAVLTGFFNIWMVIGVGFLLAHLKVLDQSAQRVLAKVAFSAGLPAMLFLALLRADVARLFSVNVAAIVIGIVAAVAIYVVVAKAAFKRKVAHLVIGSFGVVYMNANNMGVPIASYVLGDASYAAPVLMVNQILLQPIGLTILDIVQNRGSGGNAFLHGLSLPFRNPMTLAVMAGMACNLLDIGVPSFIEGPATLVGGLGVPALLISFGISLRLSPLPTKGPDLTETVFVALLKLFALPILAALAAHFIFGLDAFLVKAVAVMAGLPSAQNVFVFAMRFNQSVNIARDVVMITSIGAIGSITLIVGVLNLLM